MSSPITERINSLLEKEKHKKKSAKNQAALAQAIGIKKGTLSANLKDNKPVYADYLVPTSILFDVSITYLLTGDISDNSMVSETEKTLLSLFRQLSHTRQEQILNDMDAYILQESSSNVKKGETESTPA